MVMEEVVTLRKELIKKEEVSNVVNRLKGVLGVRSVSQINEKVVALIGKIHSLKSKM